MSDEGYDTQRDMRRPAETTDSSPAIDSTSAARDSARARHGQSDDIRHATATDDGGATFELPVDLAFGAYGDGEVLRFSDASEYRVALERLSGLCAQNAVFIDGARSADLTVMRDEIGFELSTLDPAAEGAVTVVEYVRIQRWVAELRQLTEASDTLVEAGYVVGGEVILGGADSVHALVESRIRELSGYIEPIRRMAEDARDLGWLAQDAESDRGTARRDVLEVELELGNVLGAYHELLDVDEAVVVPTLIEGRGRHLEIVTRCQALMAVVDRGRRVEATVSELGDVGDLGSGFSDAAGAVLEQLAPPEGGQFDLLLALNLRPVDWVAVAASIGLEFELEVERDRNGYKVLSRLACTFTGEVDLHIVEAFMRADIGGFVEIYADNGPEVFQLIALAIEQRLRRVSDIAADLVFGEDRAEGVIREMDGDDYVESGWAIGVSAGLDVHGEAGIEVGVRHRYGTRLARDPTDPSRVVSEPMAVTKLEGAIAIDGVSGELEVEHRSAPPPPETKVKGTGGIACSVEQLETIMSAGRFVSELVSEIRRLMVGMSGAVPAVSSTMAILETVRTGGVGGELLADAALDSASEGHAGVDVGWQIVVDMTFGAAAAVGVLKLEQTTTVDLGSRRSPVGVEIGRARLLGEVSLFGGS